MINVLSFAVISWSSIDLVVAEDLKRTISKVGYDTDSLISVIDKYELITPSQYLEVMQAATEEQQSTEAWRSAMTTYYCAMYAYVSEREYMI